MKRFIGSINRRGSQHDGADTDGDSPEANIARGVRLFCESGGPNNSGEEVLYLPTIVEAAESSPSAAKEAANVIRKFLSKANFQRAYVQYNAIMLLRILADNPGKTFTRNLDTKFVTTVKELLRDGKDMSVQQILRETLDTFEVQKAYDETLSPLRTMWMKEKQKISKSGVPPMPIPRTLNAPAYNPNQQQQQQNYFSRSHRPKGLPPPHELSQRVEEARTSGQLLIQVLQSTSPNEILGNELIKEFAERCQSASRSIQGYINSEDPPPDHDTHNTLNETYDQLSLALSKHQRALLQARRTNSSSTSPPRLSSAPPGTDFRRADPTQPPQQQNPFNDTNNNNGYSAPSLQAWEPNGMVATSGPLPPVIPEMSAGTYHSDYRATQSYQQRQENAINNMTMRGAAAEEDEPRQVPQAETRKPMQYRF